MLHSARLRDAPHNPAGFRRCIRFTMHVSAINGGSEARYGAEITIRVKCWKAAPDLTKPRGK